MRKNKASTDVKILKFTDYHILRIDMDDKFSDNYKELQFKIYTSEFSTGFYRHRLWYAIKIIFGWKPKNSCVHIGSNSSHWERLKRFLED